MARRTRIAAYGLIVQGDQILLCRLSKITANPGEWTLPGGGIDFGEHPERAVVREVEEETGLIVEVGPLQWIDAHLHKVPSGEVHSIQIVYECTVKSGVLRHEVMNSTDRCEWFPIAEAKKLPLVPLSSRAVQHVSK